MIGTSFRSAKGSSQATVAAFLFALAVLLKLAPAGAQESSGHSAQPEAGSGRAVNSALVTRRFIAVSANPHASKAAADVLASGGNALDAALAAQWVLNLVEPQSSGIGGGAFLLYWDARAKKLYAWDGRETAPRATTPDFARKPDGSLSSFEALVATGKSVGTPGLVAMLAAAHAQHGHHSWASSFAPAVALAMSGFAVSPRLHKLLAEDPFLRQNPAAARLYYHLDGTPRNIGERLRNRALAKSLRRIAAGGARAFYRGALAHTVVAATQAQGGALSLDDLASYQPQRREAVCAPYRGYRVCGMPPPSSGGIALAQLLGILERSGAPLSEPGSPAQVHRFAEAGRLVFADRARYLADPDFVCVPQAAMLDYDYLAQRAALIDPAHSMGRALAGELVESVTSPPRQSGIAAELPATSHLSIVDAQGNALAMTSSIESAFGSRILVDGFLLNNQLTDFSFAPESAGAPVANRLEAGKRPLSSMAPTLVFAPDGKLWAVLGSPGGGRIINYVAQTLVALIDAAMTPAQALAQAHFGSRNGPTEIEAGPQAASLAQALQAMGHQVRIDEMTSGTHLIVRTPDGQGWIGAADPRREGVAAGQ